MLSNLNKIEVQNRTFSLRKNTMNNKKKTKKRRGGSSPSSSSSSSSVSSFSSVSKTPHNLVTMGKLKEYKNAKNSKKFEHMKKIINFYAHKGEELRPDLEPYVFLLLVDFKFIKKSFQLNMIQKQTTQALIVANNYLLTIRNGDILKNLLTSKF